MLINEGARVTDQLSFQEIKLRTDRNLLSFTNFLFRRHSQLLDPRLDLQFQSLKQGENSLLQSIPGILPFHDRFAKELRENEMDSGRTVYVGSVSPTMVTQTNCHARPFKFIHTWFSGVKNRSGTLVHLMISPSWRLNLSL